MNRTHPNIANVRALGVSLIVVAMMGFGGLSLMPKEPMPPQVDIGATVNPGPNVERELCLRIALGAAASAECGDLRISHALPTTTTFNRARTPILSYSSHQAHPYPLIRANVTLDPQAAVPDSVTMKLFRGGASVPFARETWDGDEWSPGQTRRTVFGFDADTMTTGLKSYTLRVTNHYGPVEEVDEQAVEIAVVNRERSPFGSGWWLLGIEQLLDVLGQSNKKLWIGGEGSTRIYTDQGNGVWTTPNRSRPDTIRAVGATFERLLPGKIKVVFDASGRHTQTIPRLSDQATVFAYDGLGRLSTITMPVPSGASSRIYTFTYGASSSGFFLASVSAPLVGATARTTMMDHTGSSGMVTRITDPDGGQVDFAEDSTFTHRIIRRTNRGVGSSNERVSTDFTFNRLNQVESSRLDPSFGQDSIIISIAHGETQSLDHFAPFHTAVKTVIDGPRIDVSDLTTFSLNGFGAPDTIVDARNGRTTMTRGKAELPALVTRVIHPNNRQLDAVYNDRGNVDTLTVDGPSINGLPRATTTVEYGDPDFPDFPTRITQPVGEFVQITYDATGNRSTIRDGRGASSEVQFRYYSSATAFEGLLRATDGPATTASDSVGYDSHGNVSFIDTPLDFRTQVSRDEVGRVRETRIPINTAQTLHQVDSVYYDLADRVTRQVAQGPQVNCTIGSISCTERADRLVVTNSYDNDGNLQNVLRSPEDDQGVAIADAQTAFTVDRAGRPITKDDATTSAETLRYDPAGNVITTTTRRGHVITMVYDELNRLITRTTPSASYSATDCDPHVEEAVPGSCQLVFPFYPNNGSGLLIPHDVATFTYDAVGNMRTANNGSANVIRTYNRDGTLASETQTINPSGFGSHSYAMSYAYDLNGRRKTLTHPTGLTGGQSKAVTFVYDTLGNGLLKTVTDINNHDYTYGYDGENRVTSLTYPGSIIDSRNYDDDGRLNTRTRTGLGTITYTHDPRNKVTNISSTFSQSGSVTVTNHYSGLGALASTRDQRAAPNTSIVTEVFETDALGNVREKRRGESGPFQPIWDYDYDNTWRDVGSISPDGSRMFSSAVRASTTVEGAFPDTTYRVYDNAGNVIHTGREQYTTTFPEVGPDIITPVLQMYANHYYGADDKLRFFQRYLFAHDGPSVDRAGVFEEYRYDALGRRVLTYSRQDTTALCTGASDCITHVERYVWDGDQLLYELRGTSPTGSAVDLSSTDHGKIMYTYGLGIDSPLSLVRNDGEVIIPHDDYRGSYATSTDVQGREQCVDVGASCPSIRWPGAIRRAYFDEDDPIPSKLQWHGNVVMGLQDQSGLLYRRNRYYDSMTGQFTQEDPIGLAGGTNLYGFGGGDPVNLEDPFGLMVRFVGEFAEDARRIWNDLWVIARSTSKSEDDDIGRAGRILLLALTAIEADEEVVEIGGGLLLPFATRALSRTTSVQGGPRVSVEIFFNSRNFGSTSDLGRREILAHEIGHVFAAIRGPASLGSPDLSALGDRGVDTQNAFRTLFGCLPLLQAHGDPVQLCR